MSESESESKSEIVAVGEDAIKRFGDVAMRTIPELLRGTDPSRYDPLVADARAEVGKFMSDHKATLAASSIDALIGLVGLAIGVGSGDEDLPDLDDDMSDDELLDTLEDGVDAASDIADEMRGKQILAAKSIASAQYVARGALAAGLAAVIGMGVQS